MAPQTRNDQDERRDERRDGGVPPAAATALLATAGIPAERIAALVPLAGGTYNTLHRVELTDGTSLVLKVPPSERAPKLAYEHELLCGEAQFYASAAAAGGVPAPRVVHARVEPDGGDDPAATPYLLMTHSPGVPWFGEQKAISGPEQDRLRYALGGLLARLHAVTGPGFGYPAQTLAPLDGRWRPAFTAMTDAVLDDAERYGAWLPAPAAVIRAALAAAAPVLDEVTVPALVHFDLWPGNILVDGPVGGRAITGLIDGERMFWGDPLADFASLSLLHTDVEEDTAFLEGYGLGGGLTRFDEGARRRIALYRCYLYLIMLVEVEPRSTSGEYLTWVREFTAPRLEAALGAALGTAAGGAGDGSPVTDR